MRFNRPPVRYPTSSSSFSGRPTSPQLTAAEVRQRREAQDSRSRYVDLSWTQLEGGSWKAKLIPLSFHLTLPFASIRPNSTQPHWPSGYRDNLQPQSQPIYKPVQYSRSYSAASPSSRPSSSTPTLSAAEVRARREAHDSRGRAPRTFFVLPFLSFCYQPISRAHLVSPCLSFSSPTSLRSSTTSSLSPRQRQYEQPRSFRSLQLPTDNTRSLTRHWIFGDKESSYVCESAACEIGESGCEFALRFFSFIFSACSS